MTFQCMSDYHSWILFNIAAKSPFFPLLFPAPKPDTGPRCKRNQYYVITRDY